MLMADVIPDYTNTDLELTLVLGYSLLTTPHHHSLKYDYSKLKLQKQRNVNWFKDRDNIEFKSSYLFFASLQQPDK